MHQHRLPSGNDEFRIAATDDPEIAARYILRHGRGTVRISAAEHAATATAAAVVRLLESHQATGAPPLLSVEP